MPTASSKGLGKSSARCLSPHLGFQLWNGGREAIEALEQSDLPLKTTRGLSLARGFVVAIEISRCPGVLNAVVSCRRVLADSCRR